MNRGQKSLRKNLCGREPQVNSKENTKELFLRKGHKKVWFLLKGTQLRPLCCYCPSYFNAYHYLQLSCDYYSTIININMIIIIYYQYNLYLYYFTDRHISTDKLVKVAQFVSKNGFFEFNNVSNRYLEQRLVLTLYYLYGLN